MEQLLSHFMHASDLSDSRPTVAVQDFASNAKMNSHGRLYASDSS